MSNKPCLKIAVVSPLYHPSLGGLGRQAQLLTERLAEQGVDVLVISRRMKGMPPAVFSEKVKVYKAWSIKPYLHNFEKVTVNNILVSLTFSLCCAFLLFRKRKDYDIVHFHGASLPLFVNLPLLKILRKKVIAKVASARLGIEPGSLRGRYFGLGSLIVSLLQMVDIFIATTQEIEEGLLFDGFSPKRIARIPNFVDLNIFSPAQINAKEKIKADMGFGKVPIVIFTGGRFIPCKGVNVLLGAWSEVSKDFPDAKLVLLGNDPSMNDMKVMADALGISGSVVFQGRVTDVADFLHATDVFVLPSLQEGMPNSLLEAMACGLPVVATMIGGAVDLVEDRVSGILVSPNDTHALAESIKFLLRNEPFAIRIGDEAYQVIKKRFSLDGIVGKYMMLYQAVIGSRGIQGCK